MLIKDIQILSVHFSLETYLSSTMSAKNWTREETIYVPCVGMHWVIVDSQIPYAITEFTFKRVIETELSMVVTN